MIIKAEHCVINQIQLSNISHRGAKRLLSCNCEKYKPAGYGADIFTHICCISVEIYVLAIPRLYCVYNIPSDIYAELNPDIRMQAEINSHTQRRGFPPQASGSRSILWWVIVLFLIKRTGGHEIAVSFFTAAALHESKLMIKTLSRSKSSLTPDW